MKPGTIVDLKNELTVSQLFPDNKYIVSMKRLILHTSHSGGTLKRLFPEIVCFTKQIDLESCISIYEYLDEYDLEKVVQLKQISSESVVKRFMLQLLEGLQDLHSKRVINCC